MRTPVSGATTARGTTNDHGRGQNANPASPAPPAPLGTDRRKWLILAVIAIASLMVPAGAHAYDRKVPAHDVREERTPQCLVDFRWP